MPIAPLRLIKNSVEFLPKARRTEVPKYVRGIYVLYKHVRRTGAFNVVYVGMAGGEYAGIKGRLRRHEQSKAGLWTHFSVYQVWDNIREEEIRELEGLFRQIYQLDSRANSLNKQKSFKKLNRLRSKTFGDWT